MRATRRRLGAAAIIAMLCAAVVLPWFLYIPAREPDPAAPTTLLRTYEIAQDIVADLPESDRDKIHLVPPGTSYVGRVPCWPLSLQWKNYYCVLTDSAVVNSETLRDAERRGGRPRMLHIIAHELGHSEQPLRSLLTTTAYPREGNANCYAGAYVAEQMGRDARVREDVAAVSHSDTRARNDPDNWNFHGTREQQMEATLTGFDGGVAVCWEKYPL